MQLIFPLFRVHLPELSKPANRSHSVFMSESLESVHSLMKNCRKQTIGMVALTATIYDLSIDLADIDRL